MNQGQSSVDPSHTYRFGAFRVYRFGGGWRVYKEWYADGPSLFEWVAERQAALELGGCRVSRHHFTYKRDAVAWVRSQLRCVHCGQALHDESDGGTPVWVDETGGDVCGSYGTFGNEPHVVPS